MTKAEIGTETIDPQLLDIFFTRPEVTLIVLRCLVMQQGNCPHPDKSFKPCALCPAASADHQQIATAHPSFATAVISHTTLVTSGEDRGRRMILTHNGAGNIIYLEVKPTL